jgi:hypothetical protein
MEEPDTTAETAAPGWIKQTADEFVDTSGGDIIGALFWAAIIVGPLFGIRYIWKRPPATTRKDWWLNFIGIATLGVFWLAVPLPAMGYAIYKKFTVVHNAVDWVAAKAPDASKAVSDYLNVQILPTPRLWHVVIVILLLAAGYAAWRKHWGKPATIQPEPISDSPPEPEPVAEIPPPDPPSAPAPELPQPVAAEPPPDPECNSVGLRWRKTAGIWQPICPRCGNTMGVVEKAPRGMAMRGVPMAVAQCAISGCHAFQKELPQRGGALQTAVQRSYDEQN